LGKPFQLWSNSFQDSSLLKNNKYSREITHISKRRRGKSKGELVEGKKSEEELQEEKEEKYEELDRSKKYLRRYTFWLV